MYENYLILISQFFMSRQIGMGDDLNIMQKSIENALSSTKPVLSVLVLSPLFGANHNDNYYLGLDRLIFLRKKSQILHKNIEFLLIDLVSNQFIFIKSGNVTKNLIEKNSCDPVLYKIYQNVLPFIDENKELIYISGFHTEYNIHNQNINLYDIHGLSSGKLYCEFQEYLYRLLKRKIFLPYDVQTEQMCEKKNCKIFSLNTEYTENRTFVEWPKPQLKQINSDKLTGLKLSFRKSTNEYDFLLSLLDRYNWNFIPYDNSVSLEKTKTFDIVGSSKYIIGPEGGICHLARMFGIPFVIIIPKIVEDISINNCKMLKKLFYHWAHSNYYLPFEINTKDPSYFIFEKDLKRKNLSQLIDSIENFFDNDQNQRIVFFTVNVNDPRTCAFVKQFCKAYDFEYGTDVQIYNPNNF